MDAVGDAPLSGEIAIAAPDRLGWLDPDVDALEAGESMLAADMPGLDAALSCAAAEADRVDE